jgi:hypothetical protein
MGATSRFNENENIGRLVEKEEEGIDVSRAFA